MAPFDGVLILGKHLGRDTERRTLELRARAAAASAAIRAGARQVATLEALLTHQPRSGSTIVVEWLRELGVPDSAIYARDWTCSTREEVVRGVAWFRENDFARGLVITAAYHVERTRRLFRQAGFEAIIQTPEGLWRFANPKERAWIAAGAPSEATLRAEGRVEALLSTAELLVRSLPGPIRDDVEIRAGRALRLAHQN